MRTRAGLLVGLVGATMAACSSPRQAPPPPPPAITQWAFYASDDSVPDDLYAG